MAERLNVAVHTVRAWRRGGEFAPAYLFGRLPRWKIKDVDAWAEGKKEKEWRRISGQIRLGEHFAREREERKRRRMGKQ